ncbi:DUF6578 domain-containing protein [Streptomyces sp. AM6-12]|uniref:DUF6578 domain-containing protein n=1 Tax=Streptomyces sp. AM6-12 TaxID=3345149 RepID=UPI0037B9527C
MPRKRVFCADWQLGCRGEPFAVGDEVTWALVPYGAQDRRSGVGHGAEARVENHGGPDERSAGRVRAIELVQRDHTPHPAAPEPGLVPRPAGCRLDPVAGSVTMESADTCPRWFEETTPGAADGPVRIRRTVGVLVTLDITGSARRAR